MALGNEGDDIFIFFEEALWGGAGGTTDTYDGGSGLDTLLVFLQSPIDSVSQQIVGNSVTLSFADGSLLTTQSIETLELHMGLPEDAGSPIASLDLSGDLLDRYEEGQLWGIV
ncbi:hypothetical protein [Sulfitobacter aestuariivivens]|uniref:hypothetical protein n=1 Tax=Sulfitobacter aestuariivivens TaxID=2766981 RepID=UPI003614FB06